MRTTKISISIDKRILAAAKKAAGVEGLSLSAFIGQTIFKRLEEAGQARARLRAARALWKEWKVPEPTPAERERILAALSGRPKRRRKAA